MEKEVECPRCKNTITLEIVDFHDSYVEVECDQCGSLMDVSYSVSVDIEDITITMTPPVRIRFACSECNCPMDIEIEDEAGSEEVECEVSDCGALLEVEWDDWGETIDVSTIEVPGGGSVSAGEEDGNPEAADSDEEDF